MQTSLPPAPPIPAQKTNILSIISLIAGILGLLLVCLGLIPLVGWVFALFGGIFGIAALVLGFLGMNQVKKNAEKGRGLAIAGLVIGILLVVWGCLYIIGIAVAGGSFLSGILSSVSNSVNP
jgi:hypothetical protein